MLLFTIMHDQANQACVAVQTAVVHLQHVKLEGNEDVHLLGWTS